MIFEASPSHTTVQMHTILPRARRELKCLSNRDRMRVCIALVRPLPAQACSKLRGFDGIDVWHFRVTRSVRVSFVVVDGRACVTDVGTHPRFDGFAAHWNGKVRGQLVPIQECDEIMSASQNNNDNDKHRSGHQGRSNPSVARTADLSAAAESCPENAKEMLWHGAQGMLSHAVSTHLEFLISEVGDIERMLSLYMKQSQGQDDAFKTFDKSVNKRISQFGSRVAALESVVSASSDRLIAQLEPMFIETRDVHRRSAEQFSRCAESFRKENQSTKESCGSEHRKLQQSIAAALACAEGYREAAKQALDRLEKRADTILDAVDGLIVAVGNLRGEVETFATKQGRGRRVSRGNTSLDCSRKPWSGNWVDWSIFARFVRRFVRQRSEAASKNGQATTGPTDV